MRLIAGLATFSAFLIGKAFGAAFTNATCSSSSDWTFNSLAQSPCLVAAYLAGVCYSGSWNIYALNAPNDTYVTPSGQQINVCLCSATFYNELQACAYCQGGGIVNWSNYIASCPAAFVDATGFPDGIPSDTAVPTWAFIDPRPLGTWSAAQAQAYSLSTSASITPGLSSTVLSTSTTTTTSAAAISSTAPAAAKSSSSTGPIVGGVVGGLAAVAIAALAIWYFLRKKLIADQGRNAAVPNYDHGMAPGYAGPVAYAVGPTPTGDKPDPSLTPMSQHMGYRPYNPNDPSTFPSSPYPTSPSQGSAMLSSHTPAPYQTPEGGYHPGGFAAGFPQGPTTNEQRRASMGQIVSPPPGYNPPAAQGYTFHPEL